MASSSWSGKSCFQCRDSISDRFKNGWRLRSGDFAQLCHRCGSVYEDGKFCETFHSNEDGWRDCGSCGKLVHCGCVVSFDAYLLLDFGGIICMDCSKRNFIAVRKDQARYRCLSLESQADNKDTPGSSGKITQIEPNYQSQITSVDLQQSTRKPTSTLTPLFEKSLSASDTDLKHARLVIPKKCAETFFPVITEPHGIPIKIQDTDGKEWALQFRNCQISGCQKFVLEGLREYMIAMNWQAGDIVKFYRNEPEGNLVIGFRKASAGPSSS